MTVIADFHLIISQQFSKNGRQVGRTSVKAAKNKPSLQSNEVAVAVCLKLPDSLFLRPSLKAFIVVPDDQAPLLITPEVEQNITSTLLNQLGITLQIVSQAADCAGDSGQHF